MSHVPQDPADAAGFSYAFQPIIDSSTRKIVAYEALIRGLQNESARHVLERVPPAELHRFDEEGRAIAISLATRLGIECGLNLNFLPRSLDTSDSTVVSTLEAAKRHGMPVELLVLEVTEGELSDDPGLFARRINEFRRLGVRFAIDDFGAGYCGLNLLADFQPNLIKLDMHMVRSIESRSTRQAIVRGVHQVCDDLGIDVIAAGVETMAELAWFQSEGIHLFQGYLFAKPEFEQLPRVDFPELLLDA